MKEEEKKIWDAHQRRLAEISREMQEFRNQYKDDVEALRAAYDGLPTPADKLRPLIQKAIDTHQKLNEREHTEIIKYMKEIEEYDKSGSQKPAPQYSLLDTLHDAKTKEENNPDKDKYKSADKEK